MHALKKFVKDHPNVSAAVIGATIGGAIGYWHNKTYIRLDSANAIIKHMLNNPDREFLHKMIDENCTIHLSKR